MNEFKPETTWQAYDALIEAWVKKDVDTCKDMFSYIHENMSPDKLEKFFLSDIDITLKVLEMSVVETMVALQIELPACFKSSRFDDLRKG